MLSIELFIFIVLVILEISLFFLLDSIIKKLNLFSESQSKPSQKEKQTFHWKNKLSS